jgi:hypothetical protein
MSRKPRRSFGRDARSSQVNERALLSVWDQLYNLASEPGIAAAFWLGLGVLASLTFSKRTKVAAASALGGAFGVALGPAFAFLGTFGSSIIVGLAQSALLFADLTLFFAPTVIAVDRVVRRRLLTIAGQQQWVAYVVAVATGLVACLAALVALWWVTDVNPQLVGSVEVAVFGGVATACVALVRADRQLEGASAQPGP